MIFSNKNVPSAAIEIIDAAVESGELRGRDGVIKIDKKVGRKVVNSGHLYFRSDLIYAAHITENGIPIAARLFSGGKVDSYALDQIVRQCGSPFSPDIPRQILVNHMLDEKTLNSYIKEHFLENVAEILSWKECVGKLYPGEVTRDFTMPNVSLPRLKQIVDSRNTKRQEFVQQVSHFFNPEELSDVVVVKKVTPSPDYSREIITILDLCNGQNTIPKIAETTGIAMSVVEQTLKLLWEQDVIDLKLGAIEVSYESAKKANAPKPTRLKQGHEPVEEFIVAPEESEVNIENPEAQMATEGEVIALPGHLEEDAGVDENMSSEEPESVNYEVVDAEDAIDIDPVYFGENSKQDETEDVLEDKNEEFDNVILGDIDAEDSTSEAENSMDELVPEENEIFTIEPEPELDKNSVEIQPEESKANISSVKDLVDKLSSLQALESEVESEISSHSIAVEEFQNSMDENTKSQQEIQTRYEIIEKECDEIRDKYEGLTEQLQTMYNEMAKKEEEGNAINQKLGHEESLIEDLRQEKSRINEQVRSTLDLFSND